MVETNSDESELKLKTPSIDVLIGKRSFAGWMNLLEIVMHVQCSLITPSISHPSTRKTGYSPKTSYSPKPVNLKSVSFDWPDRWRAEPKVLPRPDRWERSTYNGPRNCRRRWKQKEKNPNWRQMIKALMSDCNNSFKVCSRSKILVSNRLKVSHSRLSEERSTISRRFAGPY